MDIEKNLLERKGSIARLISILEENIYGKEFVRGILCSFILGYGHNCIKNRLALDN